MARGKHSGRGGNGSNRGSHRGRGFAQNGRGRGRGGYNPLDDLDFTIYDYENGTNLLDLLGSLWLHRDIQISLEVVLVVTDSTVPAVEDADVVAATRHLERDLQRHFVEATILPEEASTINVVDLIVHGAVAEGGSRSINR